MIKQIIKPNPISDFLNIELINTKFFIFDYWMFGHIFAGIFLGYFIKRWWIILGLLIAYEIFEFFFWGVFFKVERFVNIFWDLVFGMAGFFLMRLIMNSKYKTNLSKFYK